MVIDTQEKLGRSLNEEEIAFLEWMAEKQNDIDKTEKVVQIID